MPPSLPPSLDEEQENKKVSKANTGRFRVTQLRTFIQLVRGDNWFFNSKYQANFEHKIQRCENGGKIPGNASVFPITAGYRVALQHMKHKHHFCTLWLPFIACLCVLSWSCGEAKPLKVNPGQAESLLPAQATRKAALVLSHYLELKDALVATESKAAQQAASAMRMSLVSFLQDSHLVADKEAVLRTVSSTADTLLIQLDSLIAVDDASCEHQRIFFKPLSAAMYGLLRTIDLHHIPVYRQFCPMAHNEQSAYWLSLSPEIENPYFGDKMLTCGEITDTLK